MRRKSSAKIAREIDTFLASTKLGRRQHHATIGLKEQLITLLMQGDQAIARDLLIERGVLHTGVVMDISDISRSESAAEQIMTLGVKLADLNMREHGRLMDMQRYWMVAPRDKTLLPKPFDTIDFTVTNEQPPEKSRVLKQQLHLFPNFIDMSENQIREWVDEWWQ